MTKIFETGPIRPPSEANSLLLRVTRNCPWNKCEFCSLYRGQRFQTRPAEEIKHDIDIMYQYKELIIEDINENNTQRRFQGLNFDEQQCYYTIYNWIRSGMEFAFLQDANSLALKPERLAEVILYLKLKFPEIKRITSYARADILSRLSLEDLKMLSQAGINRIHSGYESGSDQVLQLINKGITKQQQIEAGKKVKEAGMELSVYYMPGLGGKDLTEENAAETADMINAVNPDFLRIRTFVVKKESDIYLSVLSGQFIELSDIEKVTEIKKVILGLKDTTQCTVKSDHIINLLEGIDGKIPAEKNKIIGIIEEFERLPLTEKKKFQLARRMALVRTISDLDKVSRNRMQQIEGILSETSDDEFEKVLKQLLLRYI